MKLLSWNVNGVRAVQKKGFQEWFCGHGADVVCLQETKAHKEQLDETVTNLTGYESFWCSGERKGYSGVATYTRQNPLATKFGFGLPEFDREGRVLITTFPEFDLYNIYFPNGKRGQERLDYKLGFYQAMLDHWQRERKQGKSLVICGDYNTAHQEIDLARPKDNQNISGFLRIERDWLDKLVALGYVDTFRMFSQQPGHYTWWDQLTRARERNMGWRIDYFFVTEEIKSRVKRAWICPEVMGSDHCPVGLEIAT